MGTLSTGTWNASTIGVAYGGTGATTLTSNGVLLGNTTSAITATAAGTAYQVLRVPSPAAAPAFGAIDISQSAAVTGTLGVSNGGTGITSLGTGVATWLGTPSSSNLASAITDETGSGSLVFAASPTFTGVPLSTTAAVDTNTTQIATTAFVIGQAASSNPVAVGTTTVGTSTRYARADHVHSGPIGYLDGLQRTANSNNFDTTAFATLLSLIHI